MEVPTIYKAYVRPKFQGISPQSMAKNMVLTYLHVLDPESFPLIRCINQLRLRQSKRSPEIHGSFGTWTHSGSSLKVSCAQRKISGKVRASGK